MFDDIYKLQRVDAYFDKIFYINLAKDVERNEHMIAQFAKFNITNYERVEAVAIGELPPFEYYRNFIKDDPKYISGSIGCRASHLKCIKIARDRKYTKALVLEDDVVFLEDPHKLLTINNALLNDWDLLYFGGLVEHFFRNQIVGAFAYGVKNTLFDNIISMGEASGMEIDNFYAKILQHMSFNYNQAGKYNVRRIEPFNRVVPDFSFLSNIQAQ